MTVSGTKGTLHLPQAFVNNNQPTRLEIRTADQSAEEAFEPVDLFEAEVTDFSRAVRGAGRPLLDAADAVDNARVLDALRASAIMGGSPVVPKAV